MVALFLLGIFRPLPLLQCYQIKTLVLSHSHLLDSCNLPQALQLCLLRSGLSSQLADSLDKRHGARLTYKVIQETLYPINEGARLEIPSEFCTILLCDHPSQNGLKEKHYCLPFWFPAITITVNTEVLFIPIQSTLQWCR